MLPRMRSLFQPATPDAHPGVPRTNPGQVTYGSVRTRVLAAWALVSPNEPGWVRFANPQPPSPNPYPSVPRTNPTSAPIGIVRDRPGGWGPSANPGAPAAETNP